MRFATYELAQKVAVQGTVENLDDGRVKIVAEGPKDEVDRFADAIGNVAAGKIKDIARFYSEPSHEFDCFSVRR
jgi:acylphosphatase